MRGATVRIHRGCLTEQDCLLRHFALIRGDGPMNFRMRSVFVAMACVLTISCAHQTSSSTGSGENWTVTWGASQQLTEPNNMPPSPGLAGNTLRQRLRLTLGGKRVRLRFSNLFGKSPMTIGAVSIAASTGLSTIDPSSNRGVTFVGSPSITIEPGQSVTSDAFDFDAPPLSDVTVSAYLPTVPPELTGHPGSRTTSFIATGNHVTDADLPGAVTTDHWYVVSGVDVVTDRKAAVVVALGNSITDGRGSGTNKNNRWPDNLARRLHDNPATAHVGVINAGLGGNAVIRGGLGPTALSRLERDVLQQSGVRWLLVLEGVNDIGGSTGEDALTIGDRLITAYSEIIQRAHDRGLLVYGATILPFGKANYDSPAHEAARVKVNEWIRHTAPYDAFVDLDSVMRDPTNPTQLRPDVDTGDHLHPNENGYVVMANAIDLKLFLRNKR